MICESLLLHYLLLLGKCASVALQYVSCGNPSHKLEVLAALADNCELSPSGGKQELEDAAEYRQKLFVEMIDQSKSVLKQCAVCCKSIQAHKASDTSKGHKSKVVVGICCHLFHKGCLETLHEHKLCPICSDPLMLLIRMVNAAQ